MVVRMMENFLELDAWLSALIFAGLMVLTYVVGARFRRDKNAEDPNTSTRTEDAALALFGLLLAFSFSGAADRYSSRKAHVLNDAIAIGDFAMTSAMLKNPERKEILSELTHYAEQRLRFAHTRFDNETMQPLIDEGRASHSRMAELVHRAIRTNNTPSIHPPLMNGLNGVTKAHDERLYTVRSQVPVTIILMLIILGVFTSFTMGRLSRRQKTAIQEVPKITTYILLISLVFAVTIDLQQPRRGIMRVSQAPMEDTLASLRQMVK